MICEWFNIGYIDLRDDISIVDYVCMLSVSLDKEERRKYQDAVSIAIGMSKDGIKKYKWSTPDHAGTRPVPRKRREDAPPKVVTVADVQAAGLPVSGHDHEKAEGVLNRRILYRDPEGSIFDRLGNPVADSRDNDMILPMPRG